MAGKGSDNDESSLKCAAEMLEKASHILRNTVDQHTLGKTVCTPEQQSTLNVARAMENAHAMIRSSTSSGTFHRLNKSERLCSVPYPRKNSNQIKEKGQ